MRWFWGLFVLAVLGVLALVMLGRAAPPPGAPTPSSVAPLAPAPAEPSRDRPTPGTASVPANTPTRTDPEAPASEEGSVRPVVIEPPASGASPKPIDPAASVAPPSPEPAPVTEPTTPERAEAAPGAETPADTTDQPRDRGWAAAGFVGPPRPEESEALAAKAGLDAALGLTDLAQPPMPEIVSAPVPPTEPVQGGPTPAAGEVKAKLETQDDGSTLVDGRFVLRGKGTRAEPYEVSWEMLVSAQETYQPRLGRKLIPDRLKMLDGRWVRIAGYVAFPIMAQSQDEMLMMLNQWDGCCIGVPPTPFDAIEVKLKAAAKGDDRLRASGTVTGILRVDPYLVKDWLVSLYLMDDAELAADNAAPMAPPLPGRHQPPQ